jgi:hypothetical protein
VACYGAPVSINCSITEGGDMRTLSERLADRKELMEGVSDHDVTICEAILELCRTLDDAGELVASEQKRLREALDQVGAEMQERR